jgi:DNA-binding transcriptional LysR family regulator
MPAARRLGLDHTTVARRLTTLETAIGARLVDRSFRGARLTDAGSALLEHAEHMEAEALAAAAALGGGDQRPSGVVRLATPEAFGVWLVAPAVNELQARYPGIQLELIPQSRTVSLSKRDADLAVTLSRPPQGRLFAQKLVDYELGLFTSQAYLDANGPIDSLEALKSHPLVWYIDEMIDMPELRYMDQIIARPRIAFRSPSIVAQEAAVAGGLGLGVLHVFSASRQPGLVRVMADTVSIRRTYWLAVHADLRRLARIRAVHDFLLDLVKTSRNQFQA